MINDLFSLCSTLKWKLGIPAVAHAVRRALERLKELEGQSDD